jgi:4-diphosphocytidyl-2-C-methyl-D-erythritol kinase
MATRVRSYSKINLGLAIGPVRADGFHPLTTLYQTLAAHDVVTVEVKVIGNREQGAGDAFGPRITLTTNHPEVPADGRNTAWRMVERALERLGIAAEVAIHIEKVLPVQGGLGAGSANAAAALVGLERELGVEVPDRLGLAAAVGSDVPLFLVGGAVLGTGRGEQVAAMPDLAATWCVVAVPEVGVSTPRAFQEWDERQGTGSREQGTGGGDEVRYSLIPDPYSLPSGLTSPVETDRLEELSHVYASVFGVRPDFGVGFQAGQASDTSGIVRSRQGSSSSETKQGGLEGPSKTSEQGSALNGLAGNILLALVRTGIENDFEQVVFPQYPLLREIKHELMGPPADGLREGRPDDLSGKALYAALSGSGSALFGLYRSEADARAAQQRVQASGCKAILTETLPRAEYWRTMFAE